MIRQVLMCPPTHFEVSYVINPWMNQGAVSVPAARLQWQRLLQGIAPCSRWSQTSRTVQP